VIDNVFVSKVGSVPEPSSAMFLSAGALLFSLSALYSRVRAKRHAASL